MAANSDLTVLAGSAAVILFMVGVSAVLGFRTRRRLSEADARAALAELEPAAAGAQMLLDEGGYAALARLADGRWMALRVMGDEVSARSYASSAVRLSKQGGRVRARFAELGFPDLNIRQSNPPAWLDPYLEP